jgi:hypothetical protein
MISDRRHRVGFVVVVVYVAVAAATIQLTTRHVRPLYEGFTPPTPYQWVNPPPEFRAGNTKPATTDAVVGVGTAGSAPSSVIATNGQITLNLPAGAFAGHPPDEDVSVHITPIDPATLGRLPSGATANGNAYRVQATYTPSGEAIDAIAKPGDVFLVVPHAANAVLFSPDGQTWQPLPAQNNGTIIIASTLTRTGYYLAGASAASVGGDTPHESSNIPKIVLAAALIVVLAIALIFGPAAYRRLRRPPPPPKGRARPTGKGDRNRRAGGSGARRARARRRR